MSHVLTIARKELRRLLPLARRAASSSAPSCVVTLFTFFWVDTFFRRNLADIRPLFSLAAGPAGLPGRGAHHASVERGAAGRHARRCCSRCRCPIDRLVLGKFLAGLGLCGARARAHPRGPDHRLDARRPRLGTGRRRLPRRAAARRRLPGDRALPLLADRQPDRRADLTSRRPAAFFLVGSDEVASLPARAGPRPFEPSAAGSRFESIQRGVIDLRDLAYYGSSPSSSSGSTRSILERQALEQRRRAPGRAGPRPGRGRADLLQPARLQPRDRCRARHPARSHRAPRVLASRRPPGPARRARRPAPDPRLLLREDPPAPRAAGPADPRSRAQEYAAV